MGPGWIKFYRKAWQEHPDITENGAWLWLLCAAEYEGDYRGKLVTTIVSIAEHWNMTRYQVRGILDAWIDRGMIRVTPVYRADVDFSACTVPSVFAEGHVQAKAHKGVEITILKYEEYQGDGFEKAQAQPQASLIPCPEEKEKNTRAKKKKEPQTQHQIAVDFFYTEYEKRFNRKYVGQVKDFAAISRLLKKMSLGDLKLRILQYLRDDDPFLVNNGHSIALIQTRINAYGAAPQKDERSDVGYLKQTY